MSRRDLAHVLSALWDLSGGTAGAGVPVAAVDRAIGRGFDDMRTPLNLQSLAAEGLVELLADGTWALTTQGADRQRQDRGWTCATALILAGPSPQVDMATKPAPAPSAGAPADISDPASEADHGPRRAPAPVRAARPGALGPVTLVSAPAGSGKTMLLSSWLRSAEPPGAVAWVARRARRDATRRASGARSSTRCAARARSPPTTRSPRCVPAPRAARRSSSQRLIEGLGRLAEPVLLVLDDLHQLRSDDALRGLEQLLARAPRAAAHVHGQPARPEARPAPAAPRRRADRDPRRRPRVHRRRRPASCMAAAGVAVAPRDVARLHERTEGWAAGLRLAAMSLARHDAPDRFVAEFSGSERTVADYLLGEVLASQPPEVRRLLLRTCILERVNGPLADLLTGRSDGDAAAARARGGQRARRRGRRRRARGSATTTCSPTCCASSCAARRPARSPGCTGSPPAGTPSTATPSRRSATRARRGLASWPAELLGRHWVHLVLDGEEATLGALLAGLPGRAGRRRRRARRRSRPPTAWRESRWAEADALLAAARARAAGACPPQRRHRAETALATVQLLRARRARRPRRGRRRGRARMLHGDGAPAGAELAALALMNLGIAETLDAARSRTPRRTSSGRSRSAAGSAARTSRSAASAALGVVANLTRRLDLAEDRSRAGDRDRRARGLVDAPDRRRRLRDPRRRADRPRAARRGRALARARRADPRRRARAGGERRPAPRPGDARAGPRAARRRAGGVPRGRAARRRSCARRTSSAVVERQWQLRAQLRLGDARAGARRARRGRSRGRRAVVQPRARACASPTDDAARRRRRGRAGARGRGVRVPPQLEIEALLLDALARTRLGRARGGGAQRRARARARRARRAACGSALTVPGARELLAAHPPHRTAHAAHLQTLLDHLAGVEPRPPSPRSSPTR